MATSIMDRKTTDGVLGAGSFGIMVDQCLDGFNGSIRLAGYMQWQTPKRFFSHAYAGGIAFHQRVDYFWRTLKGTRHMDR
mmetsp:Transcript_10595/g.23130  ORF Transcript_10595/g.23130 Transcript_10595/m.23130 type:complete len:80 (+) Transcript_10595:1768-2007(+)